MDFGWSLNMYNIYIIKHAKHLAITQLNQLVMYQSEFGSFKHRMLGTHCTIFKFVRTLFFSHYYTAIYGTI